MIAAWQKARNQPATGFLTAAQQQALLREARRRHRQVRRRAEEGGREEGRRRSRRRPRRMPRRRRQARPRPPPLLLLPPPPRGRRDGSASSVRQMAVAASLNITVINFQARKPSRVPAFTALPPSLSLATVSPATSARSTTTSRLLSEAFRPRSQQQLTPAPHPRLAEKRNRSLHHCTLSLPRLSSSFS